MESEKGQERSLQKLKDTKRYEGFRRFNAGPWLHKYFDKICVSVVYSVCLTCDRCIGFDGFVCGFRFWANFLAVLRFWTIFSSVLRFLIHPNAPLMKAATKMMPRSWTSHYRHCVHWATLRGISCYSNTLLKLATWRFSSVSAHQIFTITYYNNCHQLFLRTSHFTRSF